MAINYHFVGEKETNRNLNISYVFTNDQLADALIKQFAKQHFFLLSFKVGISNGGSSCDDIMDNPNYLPPPIWPSQ